jgi:signal transduction histidine kinase
MLKQLGLQTLRQRIAAIVIVHALLIPLMFVVLMLGTDAGSSRLYLLPDPVRVAAIAYAFERSPPENYADLIRAISDDQQQIRLLSAFPQAGASDSHFAAGNAALTSARYRAALGGRPFRIEAEGQDILPSLDRQPTFSRSAVRVVVALPSGRAIEIQRPAVLRLAKILTHPGRFGLLLATLDITMIVLLAAQTTRPVDQLVRAVRDDDMQVLPRAGPREIIELGEAFREMRARLHALLEDRTRIIAAVAHDYRTYLTRLELRTDFIDDPEQRESALADLQEMKILLDDTMTFAQQGMEDDLDHAVADVGKELTDIVQARRRMGELVSLLEPERDILACSTPISFRRMLNNLIDNAMRYGGGAALIRTEQMQGLIVVIVEDDGPGVPGERLRDLKEPFMRLETSRARHTGGTGLGLSIVEALAHRFGGDLALENRKEGGLRVVLTLRPAEVQLTA